MLGCSGEGWMMGLNFGFQNYISDWVNICEKFKTADFIRSVGRILLWTWYLYHCIQYTERSTGAGYITDRRILLTNASTLQ